MFALDLFNNDHERRLAEGAVDQLEQRRIDDLAMKMDDLVVRAKQATTPEVKAALVKEFQKCKAERDSYYKIKDECMGYGGLVGEEAHEFKGAHGKLDVTRTPGKTVVTRKEYPGSDEMRTDKFPNSRLKGKGVGSAVKSGSGIGSGQGSMRKFARLDHDANDAPNYDVDEGGIPGSVPVEKIPGKEDLLKGKGRSYYESVEDGNPSKKVFKDKAGKPVGEIGIDPESSPGNGEWYVYHYGTGYSVVGFDSAAEAKRELMYVHKHPEAVEGHESTFNEADQKKNSEADLEETSTDYSRRRARDRDPDAPRPLNKNGMPVKPRQPKSSDYANRRAREKELTELSPATLKSYADKRGAQVAAMKTDNPNPTAGSKEWVQQAVPAQQVNLAKQKIARAERQQGVTEDTGSWIVYDPETKQIKKRFKTHTAGKSYAQTHKLGFASSEYYFDNIKQGVAETVSDKTVKKLQGLFKQAKAGKLKSDGKSFTKGDHWTGAGPDDYGYTGYQGHGMPVDKKKGVAESKDAVFRDHKIEVEYPEGKGHSHIYHRKEPYRLSSIFSDANSVAARNRRAKISLFVDGEYIPNYEWQEGVEIGSQGVAESDDEEQWDSGDDVTVTQDDQSTTYQYKGCKFVVNGEEAQGEAWWYEPGDTWREADHYNYVYDESKGIDRFYNEDGQNVFNLSSTNQDKVEQFVKAKAKDFVSTMVAQPNLPTMHEQGVAENLNVDSLGDAECPRCHQHDLTWEEDSQLVNCRNCGANFEESGQEVQGVAEGFQDFNKVEPYAVCLAGKPVKQFDYYEDARRFHDNWKKKLYAQGDKAKADKITLMPLNLDEGIVASGPSQPLDDRAVRKLVWDTMKINADSGEQAIQRALSVLAKKPQSRMVQDLQDKFQSLANRLEQGVTETVTDVRAGMAKIYNTLAPKIEHYRDSFLANQLYDELENYAELHGAEREFKQMMTGARNRAHMEYDTNPGGFQNWFWFLPFGDEVKEAANPAQQAAIAIAMKKAHKQPKHVSEEQDTSGVESAIIRRIMVAHTDLLQQFGPEKVMQAAEEVAYNVGDVDEIGTSDVSAWVHEVKQILGAE